MRRIFLPFLILFFFIAESTFVALVPFPFLNDQQMVVPHFVVLTIIFIVSFVGKTEAIIYGFIFGLLHDIVYTEVLGVHLFSYGILAWISSKVAKVLNDHPIVVIFLGILATTVLEFYLYGMQLLIFPIDVTFNSFINDRLLPTLGLNAVAGFLLILPMKRFLTKMVAEQKDE